METAFPTDTNLLQMKWEHKLITVTGEPWTLKFVVGYESRELLVVENDKNSFTPPPRVPPAMPLYFGAASPSDVAAFGREPPSKIFRFDLRRSAETPLRYTAKDNSK